MKHSKRYSEAASKVDRTVLHALGEAINKVKETATAKFGRVYRNECTPWC